jgi:DNA-binding PadR family transcriptional regulator
MVRAQSLKDVVEAYSRHQMKAMRRLVALTTKENLWIYISTLLEEREYFAYELQKAVQDRFGVIMASVTAYVLLYKMEREGLVERSTERREGRRPPRKYYALTARGKAALADARAYLQILTAALAS